MFGFVHFFLPIKGGIKCIDYIQTNIKIHSPLLEKKLESDKILGIFLFLKMLRINLATMYKLTTLLIRMLSQLVQTLGCLFIKNIYFLDVPFLSAKFGAEVT